MPISELNNISIIAAIKTAAQTVLERRQRIPSQGESETLADESMIVFTAGKDLCTLLSSTGEFFGGNGFLVANPNGYSGFHAQDAARVLVEYVVRGNTPEAAIQLLVGLLNKKEASGRAISAVWGIQCDQPLELGHGVLLLPISLLPDCDEKAAMLRPIDQKTIHIGVSPFVQPPSSVLVVPHTVCPLIFDAKQGDPPNQSDPLRLHNLLQDTALVLSLIGPSHPLVVGHWFRFDEPEIQQAFNLLGVMRPFVEILPMQHKDPQAIDGSRAKFLLNGFLGASPKIRDVLRLSLNRFNQAIRRSPHGDRALDLAIALESLLVDGAGENTYKIGLRAALLLGGTAEQRHRIRAVISGLYVLRSSLVHSGTLPKTVSLNQIGKRNSLDVVNEATEIAGQIIEKVIELGETPDWYTFEITPN